MSMIESIILGLVQGLAEFLPISSSGHLAALQHFFRHQFGQCADIYRNAPFWDADRHLRGLLEDIVDLVIELFATLKDLFYRERASDE